MDALMELLQAAPAETTDLFSGSLDLLVARLGMDLALMTRVSELGCEVFWWSARADFSPEPFIQAPLSPFCERVMAWSRRTLVVRDTHAEASWAGLPEVRASGIRSFLGAPLWEGGQIIGTLGVQSAVPRDFSHAEVAMVAAVAKLISKSLEIEDLKNQLRLTREALELSSAVLEDSSLHSPSTGLPNLRYLEVWLKANLTLARRNQESMPLLLLRPAGSAGEAAALRSMGETLRGVDLMVDRGDGTILLLLPGTQTEGVPLLFERLQKLSPARFPAGATVWEPAADDLELRSALRRMRQALQESEGKGPDHLVWKLAPPPSM
jgi:hypothetical protein